MSSFFIFIIAFIARSAFAVSGSVNISGNTVGTICHDTPYLSLSQPHCCAFLPPPAPSFSH